MRICRDFDEIKAAVGIVVGVSDWIDVTQDRIEQFTRATGDDQWTHVDVARAERELPTGTTIAHGLLTLSFAPMFVRSVIALEEVTSTLNYGASRIRYLAPVPAGSWLRGRVTITAAEDASRNGLRVTYSITIEIESNGHPPAWPSSLPCITDERSCTANRSFERTEGVDAWENVGRLS